MCYCGDVMMWGSGLMWGWTSRWLLEGCRGRMVGWAGVQRKRVYFGGRTGAGCFRPDT